MKFEEVMEKLGVQKDRRAATALNARFFLRNEAIKHRTKPLYLEALQLCQKILENDN